MTSHFISFPMPNRNSTQVFFYVYVLFKKLKNILNLDVENNVIRLNHLSVCLRYQRHEQICYFHF